MIPFRVLVCVLALALLGATPAEVARQRDEAAAKEAVDGWWTDALKNRDQRLQWWREARFGCFMHWGVYSDPAGEYKGRRGGSYSEHLMRQLKIPRAEYLSQIAGNFNPVKFDADDWVTLIKNAGMRYLIITAKHHDGFAMYPSGVSSFDIADATKFKRDPMRELSEACKKQGVHFGFYYSHAFDWEHPDAPGNDWDYENPGGDKHLFEEKTDSGSWKMWYDVHPEMVPRFRKYVDEKAIPQLLELIDKYHPEIFWFDTSGKLPFSEQARIIKAVRLKDPNVVINGRAARGVGKNFGDYINTGDNPAEVRATEGDWEAIPTVNNSYGYSKHDNNYKTPEFFIRLNAKIAAKGGNSLLNIGPKGDGTIDENATRILQGIGKWMQVNGESIHGTTRTPLDRQAWGDSTLKGSTLYLHVFDWPSDGKLMVGGLLTDVTSAYLLADPGKKPLTTTRLNGNDVVVTVPSEAPDKTDAVVVLNCATEVKARKGRLLATNIKQNRLLAFDAEARGKFSYGDGKAERYYAEGFKQRDDELSWPIRLHDPASFEVSVRYIAPAAANVQIGAGDQSCTARAGASQKPQFLRLGALRLESGAHVLRFSSSDALSLFEVILELKAQ
jgi:alpha-L-fucosidase